jgi:hypothetical protein
MTLCVNLSPLGELSLRMSTTESATGCVTTRHFHLASALRECFCCFSQWPRPKAVTAACCHSKQASLCLFCLLLSLRRPVKTATRLSDTLYPLISRSTRNIRICRGRTCKWIVGSRLFLAVWRAKRRNVLLKLMTISLRLRKGKFPSAWLSYML